MIDLLDLYQELHGCDGLVLDPLLEFLCPVIGEKRVNDHKGDTNNADGQGREV